jgi:hypothetical protein
MSLEEKLAATRAGAATRIPPERQAIMHRQGRPAGADVRTRKP